ncbi:hypothetical protein BVX95_00025 [archaeon D22]|nr:hypothetical protein BVX95_00025 [archaeon D22]
MKSDLYATLFSVLSLVASEKDYLENLTSHSDAIHKHLGRVDISDFEIYIKEYFSSFLKYLRKQVSWDKITIAFDETFIPFYGEAEDNWIVGYNNKVKGAKGSFKFMVCSIVVHKKRFVLSILPMHNNQDTNMTVHEMIALVKKKFRVETVLFDRGFCNKKLCRDLEKNNTKYLILAPKWSNISRYLQEKKDEVLVESVIGENKTKNKYNWRFVFAYELFGHDWAFATNLSDSPSELVKLYKCRWGIETNFRVMDFADIKSKSKNIVTQCFFFLISAILFNSWLELDKEVTFETYLDSLALANMSIEELLNKFKNAKELLNMKLTEQEEKYFSSFANDELENYLFVKNSTKINKTMFDKQQVFC